MNIQNAIRHGGCFVIVRQGGGILFGRHSYPSGKHPAGMWGLLGGGIFAGEDPETAAMREAREEANLVVHPDDLSLVATLKCGELVLLYEAHTADLSEMRPDGKEISELRVFSPHEIAGDTGTILPAQRKMAGLYYNHWLENGRVISDFISNDHPSQLDPWPTPIEPPLIKLMRTANTR